MNIFRLYELREYNNLTEENVADVLGIKQQTYSSYETERRVIPLKHLITLCKYYNVSLDYLTGLYNDKNSFYKYVTLDKDAIGKRLKEIRELNHLKQKDLAKVLNTTSSTLSAYEHGHNLIITAFAYQICRDYHISFDWLVGASTEMKKDS